jgi:alpha-tubulin suppressor-like RCC1 family protein
MVAAGGDHSLVVSGEEGKVCSFGGGFWGRLGHGTHAMVAANEMVPRPIDALDRMVVVQVAVGKEHSMALSNDGKVFTWGSGRDNILGHGEGDDILGQLVPKQLADLGGVKSIAAGDVHSLAVVGDEGRVYAWGSNDEGQLGQGDHGEDTDRSVPTRVPGVSGAAEVATGSEHTLVLCRDGTVMSCGSNSAGQLGLGGDVGRLVAILTSFEVVNGLPWGVVAVDAGDMHSIAVTLEGAAVYTWGSGSATGRAQDRSTREDMPNIVTGGGLGDAVVVHVAAGHQHSMALTATGELWTWGHGDKGQLGHGTKESSGVPRVVNGTGVVTGMTGGLYHSLLTTATGSVLSFGDNIDSDFGGICGKLGLGAEVEEALTPLVVEGITVGGGGEGGVEEENSEGKEGKE